jgi:hypothetical protein
MDRGVCPQQLRTSRLTPCPKSKDPYMTAGGLTLPTRLWDRRPTTKAKRGEINGSRTNEQQTRRPTPLGKDGKRPQRQRT